jgi:5-methyltetrahydropteroyltriglutamate--homocysteine methyltransferase
MTVGTAGPPFRAEHVGSLKRPEGLQRTRERLLGPVSPNHNLGPHNNAELRQLENEAVKEVIAFQENLGLRDITDGEFRRCTWWTDFLLGFEGVVENKDAPAPIVVVDSSGHRAQIPSIAVKGSIKWKRSVVREGFEFLKAHTRETPKLSIPAPMELHYLIGGGRNIDSEIYPDFASFAEDLASAYQREIAELAAAGCRYLQLDDVTFGFLCDPKRRAEVSGWGTDPNSLLRDYVGLFNRAVANRPSDMVLAIHVCRGNRSGHWGAEGGYDLVAELLFNKLDADVYFLEYDSPRAGTFEPLRYLPENKRVVLGLVTTKESKLESADALKRRIDEAARYAPLERLALSPQCGFSANYIGNPVTIVDERRKLSLVVDVARDVWGQA